MTLIATTPPQQLTTRLYRDLYLIRRVEQEVARVYPSDKIQSPVHLSIGQEAVAVGVCSALRPDDVVYGTYRSHAMYLAKGGGLPQMIAELYGKATGCAKGKGGSMHMIDVAHGVMGTSAVVGTTIPHAVGHALAFKTRKQPQVAVSFFGDGAVEEGAFHESLNFAALRRLPVLFICENNFYAIHSRLNTRQNLVGSIAERAASYGIRSELVDDGDVFEIRRRALAMVEEMRSGKEGPRFLECKIYRWKEHVGPNDDFHFGYRSRDEAESWIDNDQIERVGALLDERAREAVQASVEAEIAAAFRFAEESPAPDARELHTDVV